MERHRNQWLRILGSAALGLTVTQISAMAQGGPFIPTEGLLVMEIESGTPSGSWASETDLGGYAGSSYVRWNGPNLFQSPGSDVFGFDFQIDDPGRYHFRIHNRHDHSDSTEANDVFVRMDGGPWVKTFSWERGQWSWATQHEFSHSHKPPAEYTLREGLHRIEFSGRSRDFMMDRIHLYADGTQDPLSLGHPESSRGGASHAPIAVAAITPATIPANDNFSTVVTLNASRSLDVDGDELFYNWKVRGARFVQGTGPRSRIAKIVCKGEFAVPIQLSVSDGEHPVDNDFTTVNIAGEDGTVGGAGCLWHPMTIDFEGPWTDEMATSPNPFLDYSLNVTLTRPDGSEMVVPGFFDGDGEGGSAGNIWRVRFSPDAHGVWEYESSFRSGEDIAIDLDTGAGQPVAFNGASGRFGVMGSDGTARGFLGKGRLDYVGDFYLRHMGSGEYFIKTGTNSPENFMGFAGFDGIQDNGGLGIIHEYGPHRADWTPGDPLFRSNTTGVDSRGIIGALNYLGDQGVNSLYFLPMNMGGDGQETTPFVGYERTSFTKTHYDISRLHQWNQVLNHAQEQGILVQFVLAETESENENWLDNGAMGRERKLFFRELAARFSYLNGIKWNLSEENDFSVQTLREMASYMKSMDPYDHPVAVHTHPNDLSVYYQLAGDPLFDAASGQYSLQTADAMTTEVRNLSASGGRKWIVDMDENGHWEIGANSGNAAEMRREVLYDVLFSNGGIEWYAGYHDLPLGGDVKMENFRTREEIFRYSRIAREFMEEHLDYVHMTPSDHFVDGEAEHFGGAEMLFTTTGKAAIFLPNASSTPTVDLSQMPGTYAVRWFDPRTGDEVAQGPNLQGGATRTLDVVVADRTQDWIVLLERTGTGSRTQGPDVKAAARAEPTRPAEGKGSGR